MSDVPEGFREIARLSPFNALVGPLYERRAGRTLALGMRIEAKHSNSRGVCHGGVLATFADLAMGYAMQAYSEAPALSGFVTAQLSVDYAGAAKLGDWIESWVEVQRVGARLAFASGYILARGERIVRASAIFARAGKEE
jgi:uncharacterized protein (TIGR00369 family)